MIKDQTRRCETCRRVLAEEDAVDGEDVCIECRITEIVRQEQKQIEVMSR